MREYRTHTEEQEEQCRDFLRDIGYDIDFCILAEYKDIIETMREQYSTVLERIENS